MSESIFPDDRRKPPNKVSFSFITQLPFSYSLKRKEKKREKRGYKGYEMVIHECMHMTTRTGYN